MSLSNTIVQYIQLMDKIEDMIGELSGVSRQRQGQVQTSELVGNVQQTIIQSSHITEYLFYTHTQFKKRVLNKLMNTAKVAWKNSGKKKLHYITNDLTRVFMDITDDFLYSDLGIFVTDSTKEQQNIEALRQLAQPAMQNGASLLDVAELYTADNLVEIKNRLSKIEAAKEKREDQMQQLQQQAQMAQTQATQQIEQDKLNIEQAKIQAQEAIAELDSQTKLQIAYIGAESKNVSDVNKQVVEIEKINSAERMNNKDMDLKSKELAEETRSNKADETIKRTAASKPTTTSK